MEPSIKPGVRNTAAGGIGIRSRCRSIPHSKLCLDECRARLTQPAKRLLTMHPQRPRDLPRTSNSALRIFPSKSETAEAVREVSRRELPRLSGQDVFASKRKAAGRTACLERGGARDRRFEFFYIQEIIRSLWSMLAPGSPNRAPDSCSEWVHSG